MRLKFKKKIKLMFSWQKSILTYENMFETNILFIDKFVSTENLSLQALEVSITELCTFNVQCPLWL